MGWGVNDYPCPPPEAPWPTCPESGFETEFYLATNKFEIIGCEDCIEPEWVNMVCPICQKEVEEVYKKDGEIVACEYCIRYLDAWNI